MDHDTEPPEQKSEAKDRSALQNEAGPFTFRKKEHVFAGEEFCSSVGSDAQAVTEKRRVGVNVNDFL